MKAGHNDTHWLEDLSADAYEVCLWLVANQRDHLDLQQRLLDIIFTSLKVLSNDPKRYYLDPARTVIIEWTRNA